MNLRWNFENLGKTKNSWRFHLQILPLNMLECYVLLNYWDNLKFVCFGFEEKILSLMKMKINHSCVFMVLMAWLCYFWLIISVLIRLCFLVTHLLSFVENGGLVYSHFLYNLVGTTTKNSTQPWTLQQERSTTLLGETMSLRIGHKRVLNIKMSWTEPNSFSSDLLVRTSWWKWVYKTNWVIFWIWFMWEG